MLRRIWIVAKHSAIGYSRDNCSQQAAAITYYVLFSMAPLAIVVLTFLGFFLDSQEVRDNVVDWVLEVLPLRETDGRDSVIEIVETIQNLSATVALASLVLTLWVSLSVFASIRRALNNVWGIVEHRPWAQGKVVDLLQVGVVSAVLLGSVVLTAVIRAVREATDKFGPFGGTNDLWEIPAAVLPAILTFAAFAVLYRIVPAAHPRWRSILPGAAFATLLFEALKNSFAFYIANFNNFDVVYGSLAGLLIFLFYMFLASNILLIGAELTRTLELLHEGAYEREINPPEPLPPVSTRALRALKSLFVRD